METLPEIISQMRGLGLTQKEVGVAIHVSQGYVSDVERGERGNRTPAETLNRAIKARDLLIESINKDT